MKSELERPLTAEELATLVCACKELPVERPDADRRDEVRGALLAAAQSSRREDDAPPARRWRRPAAVIVTLAAAAAAALLIWLPDPSAPVRIVGADTVTETRATVQAPSSADFVHTASRQADGTNDEVVRVKNGRVTVAVEKLRTGERFRVVTRDAEVEVRGTAFDVDVVDDELRGVDVHHGLVEVRVLGRPPILLHAGERWRLDDDRTALSVPDARTATAPVGVPGQTAPVPAPDQRATTPVEAGAVPAGIARLTDRLAPGPAGEHVAAGPAAPAPTAAADTTATAIAGESPVAAAADATAAAIAAEPPAATATVYPSRTELSFESGWHNLRSGNFGVAADDFGRAIAAEPDEPLAEDARYWYGVALARAGRRGAAERALADFLQRHPSSLRYGRAALMLGWMLAEDGDRAGARARFESAAASDDDDIQAQAKQGLDALR